jgi:hypothetical protein
MIGGKQLQSTTDNKSKANSGATMCEGSPRKEEAERVVRLVSSRSAGLQIGHEEPSIIIGSANTPRF